jgi:hypothetical protein
MKDLTPGLIEISVGGLWGAIIGMHVFSSRHRGKDYV